MSLIQKQECYDLRCRKNTFQIKFSFNQATKQQTVNIVQAKTYSGLFNSQSRNAPKEPKPQRTVNLPTLITTQDFEECGKVANYLKLNPNESNYETAKHTRIPVLRVASLRAYLEQNGLSDKPAHTSTIHSPRITATHLTNSPNNSHNEDLIKWPYCSSCVAKAFLKSHIQKQHPNNTTKKTNTSP